MGAAGRICVAGDCYFDGDLSSSSSSSLEVRVFDDPRCSVVVAMYFRCSSPISVQSVDRSSANLRHIGIEML